MPFLTTVRITPPPPPVFKQGLLIRALTICNTQKDFFQAAIHYAQGLVARGFPASSHQKAWRKFSYEELTHPSARRNLTNEFKQWLAKQDFSHAHIDEAREKQQRLEKARNRFTLVLLCGLTAANNIFKHRKMSPILREAMGKKEQTKWRKRRAHCCTQQRLWRRKRPLWAPDQG